MPKSAKPTPKKLRSLSVGQSCGLTFAIVLVLLVTCIPVYVHAGYAVLNISVWRYVVLLVQGKLSMSGGMGPTHDTPRHVLLVSAGFCGIAAVASAVVGGLVKFYRRK